MTIEEHSEPKRNVYDSCDPQYLRELRERAGMDVQALARTACLSVAQVRQLETDASDGLFYSDAIKRQAYKRLLMILGAEPPTVELPLAMQDAAKVAEAHLNTLDQIVAMSQQPAINRTSADVWRSGVVKLKEHQQALGALLLLVLAGVLFFSVRQQSITPETPALKTTVAEVAPAAAPEVSAPELPASTPASAPEVLPAASAPVTAASAPVSPPVAVVACAYTNESLPELTSSIASKEGRYVYMVSPVPSEICIVDGNKQATFLQMKAGDSRSVYGVSPWQVSSSQLSKLQIYFQGGRVTLVDTATRVKLLEVPVSR
jgi:transcriptional regulator with XRE-family HTH domain